MKYALLYIVLIGLGLCVVHLARMGKQGRAEIWVFWRPYLPVIVFAWLATLAAILIAYFGGHIRVL
jgi:hypothetical protein